VSEAEKKRRLAYKENRDKWILIQIIAIALLAFLAVGLFVAYSSSSRTYYITCAEQGQVDYKVHVQDNAFYGEAWLDGDQAYVVSLVDRILADFEYKMVMDTDPGDNRFDYNYQIDAQLVVTDEDSGIALYDPSETLVTQKTGKLISGRALSLKEKVDIDFVRYNQLANDFISTYQLKNVTSVLNVTMTVNVQSSGKSLVGTNDTSHVTTMQIPLAVEKLNITTKSSPSQQDKVMLATEDCSTPFLVLAWVATELEVLLVGFFVAFIYLTRNTDINYEIKVKRILSSYRSFIQKIDNPFDCEGYQLLYVNTFPEMLGIRDTISSPILMSENEDATCTQFLIPTNTKILYVFEIKVDNFDAIYNAEPVIEEPIILEEVDSEALAEALATPDIDLDAVEYIEDDDKEEEVGVEVIGVVWPEKAHKNKVYRYDPNGETLEKGDEVLVPSRDVAKNKDIIRKAAVTHGNHKVAPETLKHPLKKIIGVVKRKAEAFLTPHDEAN